MKILESIVGCKVMFAITRMLIRAQRCSTNTELCLWLIYLKLRIKCSRTTKVHTLSIRCTPDNAKAMLDTLRSQCICLDFQSLWVLFCCQGITGEFCCEKISDKLFDRELKQMISNKCIQRVRYHSRTRKLIL